MQIKLSKSQWQHIGKITGWMKTAQNIEPPGEYDTKKLLYIFQNTLGNLNVTDRVYTYTKTLEFNDVAGDAYISISYDYASKPGTSTMHVEKYYDSEFLQNEMGKVINVPINWNNPKETVEKINTIINSWLGNRK